MSPCSSNNPCPGTARHAPTVQYKRPTSKDGNTNTSKSYLPSPLRQHFAREDTAVLMLVFVFVSAPVA
ncbi:hypothetical protein NMY22_g8468 [Coprinellus aureogranulatus]|nr:hypothetical protein NMY22_g8468 [Coprinellus aureogranulatus]